MPKNFDYGIEKILDHSPKSFTQGLLVDNNHLIESSGLYGRSYIRRYDRSTGQTQQQVRLPDNIFAEGIAIVGNQLYSLSWKSGIVHIFDKQELNLKKVLRYSGQGWGLTTIGSNLVMSNGSGSLTWRDAQDFRPIKMINVTQSGRAVHHINDLTFGKGLIWANIWKEDRIIAIEPDSGVVVGILNLEKLSRQHTRGYEDVLNGVAWDEELQGLWVTGKFWDKRYLLKIITSD